MTTSEHAAGVPSKPEVRAAMRTLLAGVSPAAIAAASAAIVDSIRSLEEWRRSRSVALFVPIAREPDLRPLVDEAIAEGRMVALPRSVVFPPAVELVPVGVGWRDSLRPDELGVPAPPGPPIGIAPLELMVVPGLAFDAAGGRLGRGGGFYDRLLEQVGPRPRRVGVCFDAQVVAAVAREPHDAAVDLVITERRTLRSGPTDRR